MANQTVYPYGTGGSLPSSIGLVNDLKTGGVDKALTAEQGKAIGNILFGDTVFDSTEMVSFNDGKQYKADSSQVGKALSAVDTWSTSGWLNYRIPVGGAYSITYTTYSTSSSYGCLFLDGNDIVLEGIFSKERGQRNTVGIPEGAVTFIWSFNPTDFTADMKKCIVTNIKSDKEEEQIDALRETVNNVADELGKKVVLPEDFSSLVHYKTNYQLKADSSQIGKTLDNVTVSPEISGFDNIIIPIDGYARMSFMCPDSGYQYGSLILDSENTVLAGITIERSGSAQIHRVTVDIPIGAAYLVLMIYNLASYDKSVTLYKEDGIIPRIEYLEQQADSAPTAPSSGVSLSLSPGRVDNAGMPIADNKYVITEVIFGKFNIILNDGWRIYEGHLYDRSGKLVSYQILNPQVTWMGSGNWPDTWTGRTFYANTNSLPDWGMRLVLCKTDQSVINEGEVPVKSYVNLTDAGLKLWIPDDLPNYDRALRRIDYLSSLRWIPLAKVPNGYTTSSSSSASDDVANSYFNLAGQLAVGVPYSDVAETRKYVPNNVSIRTFMTATKNPRSLLYTEELHQNVSKYGMSYTSGHRRCYYGSVCNTFVGWVMGIYSDYLASRYHENLIDGLVTVAKGYQNAKPLDIVWFSGHVAIVSAVWLDEFGNRRYIEMAEMSTPYPYKILYTPEEFDYRTRNEVELHRWNGWENLSEPEDARDISQYVLGDVQQEIAYNPDIMCFAGDYAAFAEGDTIHLNARRNSVYTGVELYKNDTLLQTIDITGLSADTIVTPNTEDWVDVNLTTLNLTYGKYKARLTDGTNTTDYTYFEVIDITFTATKSGNTVTAFFSSNEGTPVSLERVSANGFPDNGVRPITAEMVEAGQATAFNVKTGHPNLILIVKGDYGTAIKVIPIPTS